MTTKQHIYSVSAAEVFRDLEPEQVAQIEQLISYQTFPAGYMVHSPEEYSEHLYLLQVGRVRLYKLSLEGRALTLTVLEPVTIFGEMTLVGHWLHDSFAETMTETVIGTIGRNDLRALLQQYPEVSLRFMELMGQRLRETENKLADIAFKSVSQRLASVLLSLAGAAGDVAGGVGDGVLTVMRYTHQQLAEMIGSYRETVTKAMGEFRDAGLIRIDEDAIRLSDRDALERLVNR